jgi:hypothetical protein
MFVRGFSAEAPEELRVDGLMDKADRIEWSRDGSAAVLYSLSERQIQRASFSETEVRVDGRERISLEGEVTALAVSGSGRQIALAVIGSEGSGLYLWSVGQAPVRVSGATVVDAKFDSSGERLFAVTEDTQQVLAVESGSAMELASLRDPGGQPIKPAAIAVSGDGRMLIVADRSRPAIRIYETVSRTLVSTIPLDFTPSRVDPLPDGRTFLLKGGDSGQQWPMVLYTGEVPAVYFIPAGEGERL